MLSETQLAERLRAELEAELADLKPSDRMIAEIAATVPRRRLRLPRFGDVGAVAAAVAAVAIGVVAVAVIGRGHPTTPAPRVPSSARALVNELGVFRRPQTTADKTLGIRGGFPPGPRQLRPKPERGLTRLATTVGGAQVFLTIAKPPAIRARAGSGDELDVLLRMNGGGCGGAGNSADDLSRDLTPGSCGNLFYSVVPDGVSRILWVFARQKGRSFPVYRKPLSVDVAVNGNVAAARVARRAGDTPAYIAWFAADGRIIKRHGTTRNLLRVVPPSKPGPETPLSRRAERDPSTPNQVTVTPTTGPPHTTFKLRFLVLLNGGAYNFRVRGGPHAGCAPSYGADNFGGSFLRGRTFTYPLDAGRRAGWCPGTYHVIVAHVGKHGRYPPFGTATFMVR